jgi:hypothetical protein
MPERPAVTRGRSDILPNGHRLIQATKTTTQLAPGESVRIAGLGVFAIAATPTTLPGGTTVVPLGWDRLAILADAGAVWDAAGVQPPIWKHRSCRACGGSGRG